MFWSVYHFIRRKRNVTFHFHFSLTSNALPYCHSWMHCDLRCTVKTATIVRTSVKTFTEGKRRKEQGPFVISSLRTRSRDFLTASRLCVNMKGSFFTPYALNFKIISDVRINFLGQVTSPEELHHLQRTTQHNTTQQIRIYLKASNSFLVNNSSIFFNFSALTLIPKSIIFKYTLLSTAKVS
jgi:hypothetical protein